MISGAHAIIYSTDAEADRAFFRDVLKFPHVDVGQGWLIFRLPPAEIALHPADDGAAAKHEIYLMCDDVQSFVDRMRASGIACSHIHDQPWGSLTEVTLPSGGKLGVYQAKHQRP